MIAPGFPQISCTGVVPHAPNDPRQQPTARSSNGVSPQTNGAAGSGVGSAQGSDLGRASPPFPIHSPDGLRANRSPGSVILVSRPVTSRNRDVGTMARQGDLDRQGSGPLSGPDPSSRSW
jgi:hypothetical protein